MTGVSTIGTCTRSKITCARFLIRSFARLIDVTSTGMSDIRNIRSGFPIARPLTMTIAVSGCCDQFTLFTYWSIIHCQSGVTSCDFAGNLIELVCKLFRQGPSAAQVEEQVQTMLVSFACFEPLLLSAFFGRLWLRAKVAVYFAAM